MSTSQPRYYVPATRSVKFVGDRVTTFVVHVVDGHSGNAVLVLYSATHRSEDVDCPVCGCWHTVSTTRLATEDEIPETAPSTPNKEQQ